jgi:hypothetical protein
MWNNAKTPYMLGSKKSRSIPFDEGLQLGMTKDIGHFRKFVIRRDPR